MSSALQRLNLLAVSVLAAVLGCVLAARVWPGATLLAGNRPPDNSGTGRKRRKCIPPSPATRLSW